MNEPKYKVGDKVRIKICKNMVLDYNNKDAIISNVQGGFDGVYVYTVNINIPLKLREHEIMGVRK